MLNFTITVKTMYKRCIVIVERIISGLSTVSLLMYTTLETFKSPIFKLKSRRLTRYQQFLFYFVLIYIFSISHKLLMYCISLFQFLLCFCLGNKTKSMVKQLISLKFFEKVFIFLSPSLLSILVLSFSLSIDFSCTGTS